MSARAARMWPALVRSALRVSPERSSAVLRLSEMVRTAMRTGRNGRLSSIGMAKATRRGQPDAILAVGEAWPFALRERGAADRCFALLRFVHPVVAQHRTDIAAGFPIRDGFHVQQRVAIVVNLALPPRDRRGAGVIGGDNLGQQPAGRGFAAAILQVALTEIHVDRGGLERSEKRRVGKEGV